MGGEGAKVFAMPMGAGSSAGGGALRGSAAAGTAICSFEPQPRQYLNWS
jgi:hypothetical protein